MQKSQKVELVTTYLATQSRSEKEKTIRESSLTDREVEILVSRYVRGKTLTETAVDLKMEFEALVKAQRKATERLYSYLFPNYFLINSIPEATSML